MIGGLFVVYGVMLTVAGFGTSDKNRAKAAGININLWLGIGMFVLGVLFLVVVQAQPAATAGRRRRDATMTSAKPVIVVGVDGSEGSNDALRWAAGQAQLTGAALRAIASWRWPSYVTRVPPGADPAGDTERTLHESVSTDSRRLP